MMNGSANAIGASEAPPTSKFFLDGVNKTRNMNARAAAEGATCNLDRVHEVDRAIAIERDTVRPASVGIRVNLEVAKDVAHSFDLRGAQKDDLVGTS